MLPLYKPGDHVLTFNWGKFEKGDVVVFRLKSLNYYIKRIETIDGDVFHLSGDNHGESANVLPVAKGQIVGRVILKY